MDKKKVGRPPIDKDSNDKARSYTASITPNQQGEAIKQFGSLGDAIKWAIDNVGRKVVLRPAKRKVFKS